MRCSDQTRHGRAPRTGAHHCHTVAHGREPTAVAMRRHCPSHLHWSAVPLSATAHPHALPVPPRATLGQEVVLIPVKGFRHAKRRLGGSMTDEMREHLVRSMAENVVAACAPLPVAVVCDDPEVAAWAEALGASVMWEPGQGLNGAVRAGRGTAGRGRRAVGDRGARRSPTRPQPREPRPVRRHHTRAGPQGRRDQRAAATRRLRLPLCLRTRLVSVPPRRGDPTRDWRSASCGSPPWPTTWTGRPMWSSSRGECDRSPPPASSRSTICPIVDVSRSIWPSPSIVLGHRRAPRRHRVRLRWDTGQVGGLGGGDPPPRPDRRCQGNLGPTT